jgi:two-component system cell cycle sensor histidine kinase PleC
LFDLIADILDMSKIEAGRYSLECSDFNLSEIADDCVRILSLNAEAKSIRTNVTVARGLTINGDARAIKQILVNLLSNAVKFTGDGGNINLRARKVSDAIVVSIEDNGIGIPKGAIGRLGRPFEQAANQMTKDHQGSGLGLAIARSLAEMHGGSLRIRSREGKGTIVTVRLPADTQAKLGTGKDNADAA